MSCTENFVDIDGLNLCWFEWGERKASEETILLVHATGFHARCWDQTIANLPGKHVIALDMRGHGRSDKTPPFNWSSFDNDLVKFIVALNLKNIVGVGHSMGGHCVTHAAAKEPERFNRLVLVDPVIMSPEVYAAASSDHGDWLDENGQHPVARRKNLFNDVQSMFENFQKRGSYGLWREDVLHDYCQYGLLENPNGPGLILACPPEVEAAIYVGSVSTNILDEIPEVKRPVTVLRAKEPGPHRQQMDFSSSPTWPLLASQFPNGRDVYCLELTHFIPMQDPGLVARTILE